MPIIKLNLIDLEHQKIKKVHEASLQLGDDALRYHVYFEASQPTNDEDTKMPWHDVPHYLDVTIKRHLVSGLELGLTVSGKWYVIICALGVENPIKVYFRTHGAAETFKNQIKDWMLIY